uniref:Uncharacterized protein n=1 Tax=Sus scrofa TaxID=9823 RepID=A0A8D1A8Q9_PIG
MALEDEGRMLTGSGEPKEEEAEEEELAEEDGREGLFDFLHVRDHWVVHTLSNSLE